MAPHLRPSATVHTVALCRNAGATRGPDLWIWTVDDWVQFPWEAPGQLDRPIEDLPDPYEVRTL